MADKAVNAFLVRPKPISMTEEEKKSIGDSIEEPPLEQSPRVRAWVRDPE